GLELLEPLRLGLLQRVLPGFDLRQVRPRRADLDAPVAGQRVDVVRQAGGDQVGLRRRAGDVRAAAAPALALDQGDPCAVVLHGLLAGIPGCGARADYDQVVVLAFH